MIWQQPGTRDDGILVQQMTIVGTLSQLINVDEERLKHA